MLPTVNVDSLGDHARTQTDRDSPSTASQSPRQHSPLPEIARMLVCSASVEDVLRLLSLVRRELGADDARLEFGGRQPEADAVWCNLEDGYRVVVIFDDTPPNPRELRDRLKLLVLSFTDTFQQAAPRVGRKEDPGGALDEALDVLAQQSGAIEAIVVDAQSPVVWGTSAVPRGSEDLKDAERAWEALGEAKKAGVALPALLAEQRWPGLEGASGDTLRKAYHRLREAAGREGEHRSEGDWTKRLRTMAAMVLLRQSLQPHPGQTRVVRHQSDGPLLARGFTGGYWLLLVFEAPDFSELHAEAAMIHALPWIERLVEALPPVDPNDGGGRVFRLRALRPV